MNRALNFADSNWLWFLVPAYLLWAVLWLRSQGFWGTAGQAVAVRFSSLRSLLRLGGSRTLRLRRLVQLLRLVTIALLLIAIVRPQTGRKLTEVTTEGIDIVLVIDTSGSMQALDLDATERTLSRRRDRLSVAKDVVEEFIQGRENDQIGMVVFGEQAFTQCPLTLDHGIVATFLDRLEIGMAGDATAIGSAIGTAVKRLRDSQAKSKVAIVLTDGRSNAGSLTPLKAAEVAETFGVKVYTIGVGTRGQAPFVIETRLGPQVVYQDVEIDEDTLRTVAERTGGAYYRAEDSTALAQVYEQIDQLERTEITQASYMEYDERFGWFVVPAVLLLLCEIFLLGTRLRKLP